MMGKVLIGNIDGKSAYELAVEEGFKGTKSEWLASLKGESRGIFTLNIEDGNLYFISDEDIENPFELDETTGNLYYVVS